MMPIVVSVGLLIASVVFGVIAHYRTPLRYSMDHDNYYSFGWSLVSTMIYIFTTVGAIVGYYTPNGEGGIVAWEYWWTMSLAYALYLAYWYFGWFYTYRIKYNRIIKGRMSMSDNWDKFDPYRELSNTAINRVLNNAEESVKDSRQWGSWLQDNFSYLHAVRSRDRVANNKPDKRRERARKALQDG